MTEKLPLVVQTDATGLPTNKPTRKWWAGLNAGLATAVTLAPVIYPEVMAVVTAWAPEFAAEYGQRIAITVAAVISVLGGSGVAFLTKNRATPTQVELSKEQIAAVVVEGAAQAITKALADKKAQ